MRPIAKAFKALAALHLAIAEISFESGVAEILTFDKGFSRMPGVGRLK